MRHVGGFGIDHAVGELNRSAGDLACSARLALKRLHAVSLLWRFGSFSFGALHRFKIVIDVICGILRAASDLRER